MRMFLVGMCDIFLLLYLTAVAQLDSREVSTLTVSDYISLKESRTELERRKTDAEKLLTKRGSDLQALERKLAALEEKTRQLEQERKNSAKASEKKGLELEQVQKRLSEKERLAAEALSREQAAQAQRDRSAAETAAAKALAERQRAEAEEARLKAQVALGESERAKKAAAAAAAQAEAARRKQAEAELDADAARRGEAQALSARQLAENDAAEARVAADQETRRAEHAVRETTATRAKIQSITQSAQKAYETNVVGKVEPLEILLRSRGFLGTGEKKQALYGVPVRFGSERVVFAPLEQTGLQDADPADAAALVLTSKGSPVQKIYINAGEPYIVGFVLTGEGAGAAPLTNPALSSYMPTLIAVRNGARLRFSDRIRSLDQDHFLFQRDQLRMNAGGDLEYNASGFRGTGDYAEYLVKGDQIVDLEGNFIGVVAAENTITPIRSLVKWRAVDIAGRSPADVLRDLRAGLQDK